MRNALLSTVLLVALCGAAIAQAPAPEAPAHNPKPFGLWVQELRTEASAAGIKEALLERALRDIIPNERVVELDRKQPESTRTFTQYLSTAVSQDRITEGREHFQTHRALLTEIGAKYGVQPQFIVALWGIETNFGGYTGNFSIIEALASLAYDGRRSEFFRKELINALHILDQGHISLSEMEGSWAGAMGQCQFMPTSFLSFAVDYDGDGRKDIWNSLPDIFASIANYLSKSGWSNAVSWGMQVRIPATLPDSLLDGKQYKNVSEWAAMGVRDATGAPLPNMPVQAALTVPGKRHENTYMVFSNYDVLLKWNRSRYFATAVGLVSDAIAK